MADNREATPPAAENAPAGTTGKTTNAPENSSTSTTNAGASNGAGVTSGSATMTQPTPQASAVAGSPAAAQQPTSEQSPSAQQQMVAAATPNQAAQQQQPATPASTNTAPSTGTDAATNAQPTPSADQAHPGAAPQGSTTTHSTNTVANTTQLADSTTAAPAVATPDQGAPSPSLASMSSPAAQTATAASSSASPTLDQPTQQQQQQQPTGTQSLRSRVKELLNMKLQSFLDAHELRLRELYLVSTQGSLAELLHLRGAGPPAMEEFVAKHRVDGVASPRVPQAKRKNSDSGQPPARRASSRSASPAAAGGSRPGSPTTAAGMRSSKGRGKGKGRARSRSRGATPAKGKAQAQQAASRPGSPAVVATPAAKRPKTTTTPKEAAAAAAAAAARTPRTRTRSKSAAQEAPVTGGDAATKTATTAATATAVQPPATRSSAAAAATAAAAALGEARVTAAPKKMKLKVPMEEAQRLLRREQELNQRMQELRQQGVWVDKRLPKVAEPARPKVHHDYLLEEMEWLSDDFRMERKWKIAVARKLARAVVKWHEARAQEGRRRMRQELNRKRKVAANVARDVQVFWKQMLKVVDFKHKLEIDAVKTEAMNKHLDYLVGQTQAFTADLTSGLEKRYRDIGQSVMAARARRAAEKHRAALKEASGEHAETDKETAAVKAEAHGADGGDVAQKEEQPGQAVKEEAQEDGEQDGDATTPKKPPRRRGRRAGQRGRAAVAAAAAAAKNGRRGEDGAEEGDTEYDVNEEEVDEEEVESSVDEEDEPEDAEGELADLAKGGEVPLSELLAMYQKMEQEQGEATTEDEQDKDGEEGHQDAEGEEEDQGQEEERAARPRTRRSRRSRRAAAPSVATEEEGAGEEAEAKSTRGRRRSRRGRRGGTAAEEDKEEEEEEKEKQEVGGGSAESKAARGGAEEAVEQEEEEVQEERQDSGEEEHNEHETRKDLLMLAGKRAEDDEPRTPEDVEAVGEELAARQKMVEEISSSADTSGVGTPVPFLLKHTLRPYQHIGLDWLATMHEKNLNGILADEMGLGKTIQTIALLAHLAVTRNNWGPHLVVVPTSVMVNWEMEIKKWCPAFKVLNYHGSIKQRREKRVGWTKPDRFHVCITSYKLAVQDAHIFKRKKWKYLILDEAHHIKNFESKRWQTLLRFSSRRRLLLTGTPLQNDLMELWSLLHFLMPRVFQSHQQFREWFGNPVREMVESARASKQRDKERVNRLHKLLRPFILRRLKADVELQMPKKYEHVVTCELSRRQRELYDEFMSRTKTKETIAAGNYLSVINILMQLRKVCNHPNLFAEPRVASPLVLRPLQYSVPSLALTATEERDWFAAKPHASRVNLDLLGLALLHYEQRGEEMLLSYSGKHGRRGGAGTLGTQVQEAEDDAAAAIRRLELPIGYELSREPATEEEMEKGGDNYLDLLMRRRKSQRAVLDHRAHLNTLMCSHAAVYGPRLRRALAGAAPAPLTPTRLPTLTPAELHAAAREQKQAQPQNQGAGEGESRRAAQDQEQGRKQYEERLVLSAADRRARLQPVLSRFGMVVSAARSTALDVCATTVTGMETVQQRLWREPMVNRARARPSLFQAMVHAGADAANSLVLPDRALIQYHCSKLQALEKLLREKKAGGHRVLIFTQMAKMLDILEQFLAFHGLTYLRLDGSTPVVRRQQMTERFNRDPRLFCFILSTRSGGLGVNLTGADTVVFYDSDWNPTMDAQAQDRCHRIGQNRDVHIYRLVCARTVEENILKKAQQKRELGDLAIEGGAFTTEALKSVRLRDLFEGQGGAKEASEQSEQREETEGKEETAGAKEGKAEAEPAGEAQEPGADITLGDAGLEEALLQAEDETDRQALQTARQEMSLELSEFDEEETPVASASATPRQSASGKRGPRGAKGGAAKGRVTKAADADKQLQAAAAGSEEKREDEEQASKKPKTVARAAEGEEEREDHVQQRRQQRRAEEEEEDADAEIDPAKVLQAQMERLRGVEHHALKVLERYLSSQHEHKVAEARQAMEEKHRALCALENRMRAGNEDELSTDEEEELFYSEDKMQEALRVYMEATSQPADSAAPVYGPPQPPAHGSSEAMAPHVETAHWAQYRVAFMHFVPAEPDKTRRRKRYRKKYKDLQRRPNRKELNVAWQRVLDLDIRGIADKRARELGERSLTQGRGISASIFRRRDDKGGRYGVKMQRHPKRPVKSSGSSKDKKDGDSNRGAPPWSIEEDFTLLSTVRRHMCVNSTVNWQLVAETLNVCTSFTGRHRSRVQCRDRYFNVIAHREDGRLPSKKKEDSKKKSKKKAGKKEEQAKGSASSSKVLTTEQLREKDNRQSVIQFHRNVLSAIAKAHSTRAQAPPTQRKASPTALQSQEAVLQRIKWRAHSPEQIANQINQQVLEARASVYRQRQLQMQGGRPMQVAGASNNNDTNTTHNNHNVNDAVIPPQMKQMMQQRALAARQRTAAFKARQLAQAQRTGQQQPQQQPQQQQPQAQQPQNQQAALAASQMRGRNAATSQAHPQQPYQQQQQRAQMPQQSTQQHVRQEQRMAQGGRPSASASTAMRGASLSKGGPTRQQQSGARPVQQQPTQTRQPEHMRQGAPAHGRRGSRPQSVSGAVPGGVATSVSGVATSSMQPLPYARGAVAQGARPSASAAVAGQPRSNVPAVSLGHTQAGPVGAGSSLPPSPHQQAARYAPGGVSRVPSSASVYSTAGAAAGTQAATGKPPVASSSGGGSTAAPYQSPGVHRGYAPPTHGHQQQQSPATAGQVQGRGYMQSASATTTPPPKGGQPAAWRSPAGASTSGHAAARAWTPATLLKYAQHHYGKDPNFPLFQSIYNDKTMSEEVKVAEMKRWVQTAARNVSSSPQAGRVQQPGPPQGVPRHGTAAGHPGSSPMAQQMSPRHPQQQRPPTTQPVPRQQQQPPAQQQQQQPPMSSSPYTSQAGGPYNPPRQ